VNLESVPAPAGAMTVVLGPGWPGILLHEAIGHGLEGDFNRKGTSAFANRIGERVAAAECTVVDDGTLSRRRGSLNIDDEGTPTQCTVLIENGILRGYMQDRMNARLSGNRPTGNGRRRDYRALPLPRASNTVVARGTDDPDALLAPSAEGLLHVGCLGAGMIHLSSGEFHFAALNCTYVTPDGHRVPVRDVSLFGDALKTLARVEGIGTDFGGDSVTCGKQGQMIGIGLFSPSMRFSALDWSAA